MLVAVGALARPPAVAGTVTTPTPRIQIEADDVGDMVLGVSWGREIRSHFQGQLYIVPMRTMTIRTESPSYWSAVNTMKNRGTDHYRCIATFEHRLDSAIVYF